MKITSRHCRAYPELALLPDDAERTACFKKIQKSMARSKTFLLATAAFGAINGVAASITFGLYIPWVSAHLPRWLIAMIPPVFLGATFGLLMSYFWHRPLQRRLRAELLAQGIAVCLGCGYDLRGQTEPRCPECGKEFSPALLGRR